MTKRLAFTPGEPAGIGPDLAIMLAQKAHDLELAVFADPQLLLSRAKILGLKINLRIVNLKSTPLPLRKNDLAVVPIKQALASTPGKLNKKNASYVLDCLSQATEACQLKQCDALVTGPIQKSVINNAGITFSGHTEYLAEKTDCNRVVMMLATEGLKVALVTTHLPLKDVAGAITAKTLTEVVTILHTDLINKFGIPKPRILVCGLNPHAGESGHLGMEEIDIIIPTLKKLQQEKNINCIGPLPADTLFTDKYLHNADAVLAMYHDQGLPVLKFKGFGQASNITLGLPIIRTSVDHGTALDLAGTGSVDIGSLQTSIDFALAMSSSND